MSVIAVALQTLQALKYGAQLLTGNRYRILMSHMSSHRLDCSHCILVLLPEGMNPHHCSTSRKLVCIEVAVPAYAEMSPWMEARQAVVPYVVRQEYG